MNINPEAAKDTPCKNVTIYGFCKYETKGCVFSHDNESLQSKQASPQTLTSKPSPSNLNNTDIQIMKGTNGASSAEGAAPKKRFNASTPSFQPSVQTLTNKFSSLSPKLKDLPSFVPASLEQKEEAATPPPQPKKFNASTPSFTPSFEGSNRYANSGLNNEPQQQVFTPSMHTPSSLMGATSMSNQQPSQTQQNPYLAGPTPPPLAGMGNMGSNQGSDYMFPGNSSTPTYALNHHLYAPAPPPRLASSLSEHQTNVNDMFIPNNLRQELVKKNEATLQTVASSTLPDHVGEYHSLVPIDVTFVQPSKVYEIPSYVYKVMSNVTGVPYAVRRIDFNSKAHFSQDVKLQSIKKWKKIRNPNVAKVHDAFTTVAFGTYAEPVLCLVYDYYPLANTLQEQHTTRKLGGKLEPIYEDLLWSYLIQITNALIHIHNHRLHAGSSLDLSKILVTNKGRLRLGAVGVDDIFELDADTDFEELQAKDYKLFGKVILELVRVTVPHSLRDGDYDTILPRLSSLSTVTYSEELIEALTGLSKLGEESTLPEFFSKHLALRSLKVLSGLEDSSDYMESQLTSEIENGRLFRLMAKIDLLVNLPEKDKADNGSFYVIKLFHQFVFNSYDEFGKPVVDLSRILVNLNKLDAGVEEKILLISAEEDSCIIVSYKEVKNIIESTFRGVFR
ncbi:hypothetical protein FT663_01985 [Candidozyma haemuli var. vulneris]|uniref:PAN2-PAN3 deadenylation complex subunit PAN3 n=1 Tax=Candidozyma haemuli TaxID=45357 RepID=A0A2V1ASL1_9ASCO|nr:hypothetical protein CXQ85_000045 [[Candida] haemuloni]KAF3988638.1 hypothetical protein FT662_03317 [[Candida] haemuloni var. vulneris]KAF3993237.1 hypothetical protein FT663_01985 [[Candida] haemuloni var. vulneris]PVH21080.1 hypothetical protein CXQ85_000045 [[Candida] haemuloni]